MYYKTLLVIAEKKQLKMLSFFSNLPSIMKNISLPPSIGTDNEL